MRRSDRKITDPDKMLAIAEACDCCRLGLTEETGAYIVPMNFGYEMQDQTLVFYFHSAPAGKKRELLQTQRSISFEMDTGYGFLERDAVCACSFFDQSIMGHGAVRMLETSTEKRRALGMILAHYAPEHARKFSEDAVRAVCVFQLTVTDWSCKEHEKLLPSRRMTGAVPNSPNRPNAPNAPNGPNGPNAPNGPNRPNRPNAGCLSGAEMVQ